MDCTCSAGIARILTSPQKVSFKLDGATSLVQASGESCVELSGNLAGVNVMHSSLSQVHNKPQTDL